MAKENLDNLTKQEIDKRVDAEITNQTIDSRLSSLYLLSGGIIIAGAFTANDPEIVGIGFAAIGIGKMCNSIEQARVETIAKLIQAGINKR